MRLKDKVAFISGGAGPMGAAIAHRFAAEGAKLIIADFSQRRLDEMMGQFDSTEAIGRKTNMLESTQVEQTVDEGLGRFGHIDVVVNVVGGISSDRINAPMLETSDIDLQNTLALNLQSIFITSRLIVPNMQKRGYGRIVNIGSAAMAGEKGQAAYSAAKAGVAALTRTMAIELAPSITVNCIAPSLIRTRVLQRTDPALVQELVSRTLVGRVGEPEDIAHAALFLASEESSFITGAILPVSGGIWPSL